MLANRQPRRCQQVRRALPPAPGPARDAKAPRLLSANSTHTSPRRYRDLSVEEALVYAYIDSAGRAGMWTRIIRARTNLHQAVVTRCLKTLETRKRIKPVKSSQYPTRKVYILAHLQPSEDVTGGPFYTDGALDTEFVRVICQWVERYVAGRSWGPAPSAHGEKTARAGSRAQAEAVRKKALAGGSRAAEVGLPRPMPPGYAGFPTTAEITRASNASGLSTVDLKEAEMRQLLDLLRWDGKLVRAWNGSWRSARSASVQARFKREDEEDGDGSNEEGSGLAYAPCGRCPVFGLCREGGPVSARKCPYFQDWLKM